MGPNPLLPLSLSPPMTAVEEAGPGLPGSLSVAMALSHPSVSLLFRPARLSVESLRLDTSREEPVLERDARDRLDRFERVEARVLCDLSESSDDREGSEGREVADKALPTAM